MKSQIEILIVLPIILCVQATLLVIGAELLDVNFSEEVTFRGLFFLFYAFFVTTPITAIGVFSVINRVTKKGET
ncbi:hypothetical protein MXL46_11730 [Heyndrickxia sporothermodurans]|uniref:hypothetical protein n=1 Tax=Heyndrickxia sporothermodurans TaxID=46224 RepID=UPI002DBF1CBF|nr:hypothetical protein [Heyndrickxia sporothermodurans]MEB6549756.1 hypothetical protein [Heyndrickxia sporothermodurans]